MTTRSRKAGKGREAKQPGLPTAGAPGTGRRGPPGWLPAAVYALLTMVLFREFIFSRDMLFGTDTIALGYVARDFYAQLVRSTGEFPLWNPLLFGGLPFVDGMHGDKFYPTTLLLFLQETHRALGWKLVLHVFLAGIFMNLWLRGLGLERGAAFFGGLVYMLGAHLVSLVYPGHDGKLFVAALTPLMFWLSERAVLRRGYADFAWLALGVALLIFTAHMQLAYFAVWGFSLYFLFRMVQVWNAERAAGTVARLVGLFGLAGILGAAAAAIQLVPPFLYLQEWSHRVDRTIEAERDEAFEYATSWSLHAEEAMALVVPEFVGTNIQTERGPIDTYWGRNPFKLNHEYAGFIPLLLAPLVFLRRRLSRDWFFLGLATLALLYALGDTTPAFRVFYHLVPGVALFRAPSSIAFLFAFSLATLGAFGLARMLEWAGGAGGRKEGVVRGRRRGAAAAGPGADSARRYLWGATAALGLLTLLVSTSVFIGFWQAVVHTDMPADRLEALQRNIPNIQAGFWITFVLAALVAGTFEGRARGLLDRRAAVAAISILAVIDLWRVGPPFIQTADPRDYWARDDTVAYLEQARAAAGEPFRAFDLGPFIVGRSIHIQNFLAHHGVEEMTGHHGNEIGRYRELIGGEHPVNIIGSELRLLDLTNVVYLLSPQPIDAPGYTEVYRGMRAVVYRNENALPRAYLVGSVEVVPDEAAVERVLAPDFDFQRVAQVPEPLPAASMPEPDPVGEVEWLARGVNEYRLRVTTDRPALLVVIENYYPAWHVDVDGRPGTVLRVNHAFRGVPLEAGEHELRFHYRSDVLRASALATFFMLGLLLAVGTAGTLVPALRGRADREPNERRPPDAAAEPGRVGDGHA